jgi:hypothetical protein
VIQRGFSLKFESCHHNLRHVGTHIRYFVTSRLLSLSTPPTTTHWAAAIVLAYYLVTKSAILLLSCSSSSAATLRCRNRAPPPQQQQQLQISHMAIAKFATVPNNAATSAIFKLLQARPALLMKRIQLPTITARATAAATVTTVS